MDRNELLVVRHRAVDFRVYLVDSCYETDRRSFLFLSYVFERNNLNQAETRKQENLFDKPPVPDGSNRNGSKSDRPISKCGPGAALGGTLNGSVSSNGSLKIVFQLSYLIQIFLNATVISFGKLTGSVEHSKSACALHQSSQKVAWVVPALAGVRLGYPPDSFYSNCLLHTARNFIKNILLFTHYIRLYLIQNLIVTYSLDAPKFC